MGLCFPRSRCEAAFKFVLNKKDICPHAAVQMGQIFFSVNTHAAQKKSSTLALWDKRRYFETCDTAMYSESVR